MLPVYTKRLNVIFLCSQNQINQSIVEIEIDAEVVSHNALLIGGRGFIIRAIVLRLYDLTFE
jgi:hypothetical protein